MRRTALLVLTSLAVTTGLTAVAPPAGATTDGAVALPDLTAFRDLVVDDAHGHVFLTGGGSNGVVVRDLEGAAVTTITNQPGASQLALSEDGSTLYVALADGDGVSAISTTTLTQTTRYPTGVGTCPSTLAVTNGKVWFGYGCNSGSGDLGVIDPLAQPSPTVTLGMLPSNTFYYPPGLQASPAKPGLLVGGEFGLSPGTLRLIDVSSGSAVLGASTSPGSNLQDFALTTDGTHVIAAYGSPYEHHAYLTTDLSADGVYGTDNPYPIGVATGAGGLVAAGVDGSPQVTVYRTDGSKLRSYDWTGPYSEPGLSNTLAPASLAFASDASRLYAVTTDYLGSAVVLHVLHDPGKAPSTIALTKPASATINHAYSLAGTLTPGGTGIPAGAVITVKRDSTYGTVNLPSRVTGSGGGFTIPDTVTKRGAYGYTATWAGDATHAGTTTRVVMKVTGLATALSITTSPGPYNYGARPLVVAHLGTTKVRTLSIYATPYGGSKTRLKTGTVDARGNLAVYYTISRRTTFTATFAGDYLYEPRSVAKTLLSRAKVVSSLYGAYGSSSGYKLFRTSVDPSLLVTVSPNNSGRCVTMVAQIYTSGAWRTIDTLSCADLNSSSRAGGTFYTTAPAGTRFRLRGSFRGSTLNVATTGAWQYGRFTR